MVHNPPEFDEAMLPSDITAVMPEPNESGFPQAIKDAALGLMFSEGGEDN